MSVIKGKSCIFREYNRINGKTCCVDISENVNPPKRIQQYSLNGDLLSEFDSVQKAAE